MKKNKYNISCIDNTGNGYKPMGVEGYITEVTLENNRKEMLALRKNDNGYWVAEDFKTGLLITNQAQKTRKGALKEGISRMNENIDKINQARKNFIERYNIKLNKLKE